MNPESTSSMVERVARAICAADELAPEPDAPIYMGVKSAKAWEARGAMARAAIAAMREPTLKMCVAGEKGIKNIPQTGVVPEVTEQAQDCWAAMIDAALKD